MNLPLHVHKKAIRSLGISESFVKKSGQHSILAGIVMRTDRIIDGFTISTATVGGMDATIKVIEMYNALKRDDINLLMINGCVISWYNVIDLHKVSKETGLPLVCVTYEESDGLEKYFMELFPNDYEARIEIYHKNKRRQPLTLRNGYTVYIRCVMMNLEEAKGILHKFTLQGAVPEPIRVARLLARSIYKSTMPTVVT
ncbi:MAG: DUF99 family protein [Candidatus Bathyarchaeota archaeon]|nr:MAG: DUF99 family protein [Candidatus Bathyarchaeota archaeon]